MGNKIILDWIGFNSVVEKRDATVFSPRACRDHPRRKRLGELKAHAGRRRCVQF